MRLGALVAILLLVAGCKATPADPPRASAPDAPSPSASGAPPASAAAVAQRTVVPNEYPHTTLQGSADSKVDLGARGKGLFWAPIFLNGSVSKAPGPVYLHIEGVTGTPGSEVEVYLLDRTSTDVEAKLLIGSFAVSAVGAPARPVVVLEVKDFESGGEARKARTKLREIAHFALAMVVKRGSVKVDRCVLTTAGEADRMPAGPSEDDD